MIKKYNKNIKNGVNITVIYDDLEYTIPDIYNDCGQLIYDCELYDNKKLFDEMSVNTSKVFNECYDWNNELKKLTSFYNAF